MKCLSPILFVLAFLACSSTAPQVKGDVTEAAPGKTQGRSFDSANAGVIHLGDRVPHEIFDPNRAGYETYWDNGYFEVNGLRLFHLDILDLIVLMSPKHRVYRVLLGPSYTSPKGIGLESRFRDLKAAYADIALTVEKIPSSWLYRPDKIRPYIPSMSEPGRGKQLHKKPLDCLATTPSLPHVRFYFEDCKTAETEGKIEAIAIVATHTADLDHQDPFVDLENVPPCPKTSVSDPAALAREGERILNHKRMGEYFLQSSVEKAMPMFRQAALAGSMDAAMSYSGLIFRYIHQDVIGDPLNRPVDQGAQEGMLFLLMSMLREKDPSQWDECTRAVLDFDTPLDGALFRDEGDDEAPSGPCAARYNFEYFSVRELEALRQQARTWATCWPPNTP